MKYDKPVMKKRELLKLGFSEKFLNEAYRIGKCAWKSSAGANSPLLFDTEALEKYRRAKCGL